MQLEQYKIKIFVFILIVTIAVFIIGTFYSRQIEIRQSPYQLQKSQLEDQKNDFLVNSINGIRCKNALRRPIAVMLAGDPIARPLSGLSLADLVIEAPVITDGINRLMAVFVCNEPEEIGSIRSARHDFISLAAGLDAIYVHWGGSHFALDKLKQGIIDNIDALPNPYNTFYRKGNITAPHNGFTNFNRIWNAISQLGYRQTTQFSGYKFTEDFPKISESKILRINYPSPYNVSYTYSASTNSYLRWRNNSKEIDALNNKQIEVKNIAVVIAASRQIEGQYNDLEIEGFGKAIIFRNGEKINAIWYKDGSSIESRLYFLDENGKEIEFVPGPIWINIIQPNTKVFWE